MDVRDTLLYREYAEMKEEIMRHKWCESQKAGEDIGFLRAMIDWTVRYKSKWLEKRHSIAHLYINKNKSDNLM